MLKTTLAIIAGAVLFSYVGPIAAAPPAAVVTCTTNSGGTTVETPAGSTVTSSGTFFPGTVVHCTAPDGAGAWSGENAAAAAPEATSTAATFLLGGAGNPATAAIRYAEGQTETELVFPLRALTFGPLAAGTIDQEASRTIAHIPPLNGFEGVPGSDYYNDAAGEPVRYWGQFYDTAGANCHQSVGYQGVEITSAQLDQAGSVVLFPSGESQACLLRVFYEFYAGGLSEAAVRISAHTALASATSAEGAALCYPFAGSVITAGSAVECWAAPPTGDTATVTTQGFTGAGGTDPAVLVANTPAQGQPPLAAQVLIQWPVAGGGLQFDYQISSDDIGVTCRLPGGAEVYPGSPLSCSFEGDPSRFVRWELASFSPASNWSSNGSIIRAFDPGDQESVDPSETYFAPGLPAPGLVSSSWTGRITAHWRHSDGTALSAAFPYTLRLAGGCVQNSWPLTVGSTVFCAAPFSPPMVESTAITGSNLQVLSSEPGWVLFQAGQPGPASAEISFIDELGNGYSWPFDYDVSEAPPTISGITPSSLLLSQSLGAQITVAGLGFTPESTVFVGGVQQATTYVDPTTLTVSLGWLGGVGVYPVVVQNAVGASNSVFLAIETGPIPPAVIDGFVEFSAGGSHSVAIDSDGELFFWGTDYTATLPNARADRPWLFPFPADLADVEAGGYYSLGRTAEGDVWAWGYGAFGQLGSGSTNGGIFPVPLPGPATAISAGGGHSFAIVGGSLYGWGYNNWGQLGLGYTTAEGYGWGELSPVEVSFFTANDLSVTAVDAAEGGGHTLTVTNDGAVWAFGFNDGGQLGDGTRTSSATPLRVQGLPAVQAVAAGGYASYALDVDGSVWQWGEWSSSGTPQLVQGLPADIVAISAGDGFAHALTSTGALYGWGSNWNGGVGDGTTEYRPAAVPVSLPLPVIEVSGGWHHSLAMLSDGSLWSWGRNMGGLGSASREVTQATPAPVRLQATNDVYCQAELYGTAYPYWTSCVADVEPGSGPVSWEGGNLTPYSFTEYGADFRVELPVPDPEPVPAAWEGWVRATWTDASEVVHDATILIPLSGPGRCSFAGSPVLSEVQCHYIQGESLIGWAAEGFTPASGSEGMMTFAPIGIEGGQIVAEFYDREGNIRQQVFSYPAFKPVIESVTPLSLDSQTGRGQEVTLVIDGFTNFFDATITFDGVPLNEECGGTLPPCPITYLEFGPGYGRIEYKFVPFPEDGSGPIPAGTYEIQITAAGVPSQVALLFVTEQATSVTDQQVATNSDPEASVTVDAGTVDGGSSLVQATTSAGTGTVAVAVYESNPGETPSFALSGGGSYVDVYVSPSSSFTSMTVQVCGAAPGDVVYWWDGAAWSPASSQSYDPESGCVSLYVDATTLPSLADLQGTFFALAAGYAPDGVAVTPPAAPAPAGTQVFVSGSFRDLDLPNDQHTAVWTWGDGSSSAGSVDGTAVGGSHTYAAPGVYRVSLTVTDSEGAFGASTHEYVVVYDASAGFATGGGWIHSPQGAYAADPLLEGRATFGFVSRYRPGRTVPDGNAEFRFSAAGLDFRSTEHEWLVVSGAKAQFRGRGTVNGSGDYAFFITAIDGGQPGGSDDRFRIRIWDRVEGGLVYDNQEGDALDADATTVLGGGSIVIHRK